MKSHGLRKVFKKLRGRRGVIECIELGLRKRGRGKESVDHGFQERCLCVFIVVRGGEDG